MGELMGELLSEVCREKLHVCADGITGNNMSCKPLGNHLYRLPGEIEKRDFPGELNPGLLPIAAVGQKRCCAFGNEKRAGASREARKRLPKLPVIRNILGKMRIRRRNNHACETKTAHLFSAALQALERLLR